MKQNLYAFENDIGSIGIESYFRKIEASELWGGIPEMKALSILYDLEFEIFFEVGKPARKITKGSHKVVLVGFSNNRYDLLFPKDGLALSAICQGLIYEIVYINVLNFGEDVKMAVEKMLHDKEYSKQRRHHLAQGQTSDLMDPDFKDEPNIVFNVQDSTTMIKKALSQGVPPFPYKIAKTLDPYIYRNVEFDVWNEKRKMELNQQLIPPLSPGVKCLVESGTEDNPYTGYIQELNTENTAAVYVRELCRIVDLDFESLSVIPIPASQMTQGMNHAMIHKENVNVKVDGLDKKFKKKSSKKYWKELYPQNAQEQTPTTPVQYPVQYFGENRQRSVSQNPSMDSGYQSSRRTNPRRHFSNTERRTVAREFETPRRNVSRPRCYTLETSSPRYISRPEIFVCPDTTHASFPAFSSIPNQAPQDEASVNVSNAQMITCATEGGNVDFHINSLPSINYPNIAQATHCLLNESGEFNYPSVVQATPPMDIPNSTRAHDPRPAVESGYLLSLGSDPRSMTFPTNDIMVYPTSTPMMINNGAVPYFYNTPPQAGLVPSWLPPNGTATPMSWSMASYYPYYNSAYQVPMTPPWTPPTYPAPLQSLPAPNVTQGYILPPVTPANYSSYTAPTPMGSTILPAPFLALPEYILN